MEGQNQKKSEGYKGYQEKGIECFCSFEHIRLLIASNISLININYWYQYIEKTYDLTDDYNSLVMKLLNNHITNFSFPSCSSPSNTYGKPKTLEVNLSIIFLLRNWELLN